MMKRPFPLLPSARRRPRRLLRARLLPLGRWVLAPALTASLMAPAAVAQDGFSFEMLDAESTEVDQKKFDDAKQALNEERYSTALVAFDEILASGDYAEFHDKAQYESAKALYRMGMNYPSLQRFGQILEKGPKHAYYARAREWLFFIARRTADSAAVLDLIATYTRKEDVPAEQADEFNYQLARFHLLNAIGQGARGVDVEEAELPEDDGGGDLNFDDTDLDKPSKGKGKGKGKSKGGDDGGFDFDDVDLGGDDSGSSKPSKGSSDDGGDDGDFDFDDVDLGGGDVRAAFQDDDFSFSMGDDEPKKKKKKRKKRKKKKRKSKKQREAERKAKEEAARKAKAAKEQKEREANDPLFLPGDAVVVEDKKDEPTDAPDEGEVKEHKNEHPKTPEESLKRALSHAKLISDDFEEAAKAKYLRGLIHFTLGEFEPSVSSFRDVVRMTKEGETHENPKLREMAFFSLARIHYQFQQFRYAIFYYERIDRDSEAWLDALFESSWAQFRLGEYEKALGNLITIQSPFFGDEYYPETHILKAITFYENCRYPEARVFLDQFKAKYGGVITAIETLIDEHDTHAALYEHLIGLEKQLQEGTETDDETRKMTERLVRLALSDKRISAYNDAIAEVESEIDALEAIEAPWGGSPGAVDMVEKTQARRKDLVASAGELLEVKLRGELKFLKGLSSKLLRIQFEIAKQEKQSLEAKLRDENQTVPIADYFYSPATDDERDYWPFEGEYWRDELGTYQYTLTHGCRPPDDDAG